MHFVGLVFINENNGETLEEVLERYNCNTEEPQYLEVCVELTKKEAIKKRDEELHPTLWTEKVDSWLRLKKMTMDDYFEAEYGYANDGDGNYGHRNNPDGFYDYYTGGGRGKNLLSLKREKKTDIIELADSAYLDKIDWKNLEKNYYENLYYRLKKQLKKYLKEDQNYDGSSLGLNGINETEKEFIKRKTTGFASSLLYCLVDGEEGYIELDENNYGESEKELERIIAKYKKDDKNTLVYVVDFHI